MPTAIMSSKNRTTVPAAVRMALGLRAGSRLEFVQIGEDRFELVVAAEPITALKGIIRKPAASVTIASMNAAILKRGAKAS